MRTNTPEVEKVSGFMEDMSFQDEDSVFDFEENSPVYEEEDDE